jgi:hypothetical protein
MENETIGALRTSESFGEGSGDPLAVGDEFVQASLVQAARGAGDAHGGEDLAGLSGLVGQRTRRSAAPTRAAPRGPHPPRRGPRGLSSFGSLWNAPTPALPARSPGTALALRVACQFPVTRRHILGVEVYERNPEVCVFGRLLDCAGILAGGLPELDYGEAVSAV